MFGLREMSENLLEQKVKGKNPKQSKHFIHLLHSFCFIHKKIDPHFQPWRVLQR